MRNPKQNGRNGFFSRPTALAMVLAAASAASPALAQEAAAEPAADDEIVITGFRASLRDALEVKRNSAGIVDAIMAEDIADFPDSNLAESIQRIPGVTLGRSDGGEGRQVTVRGLNAGFTRVRINGIEGTAATGASDILGSTNRGRGFDFSVFASELFNAVEVRKTSSADVEEGSLGATIDLRTGRPFDYDGFTLAFGGQSVHNDLEGGYWPRVTGLISDTWFDGRLGALVSVAWSERSVMEEGYEAVDILAASQDGGFCTPLGFTPQNPVDDATDGTTATHCATGLPRVTDPTAYNEVFGRMDDVFQPTTPGSGAFHPRLPRYRRSVTDYERLGITGALQWRPTDATDVNLDMLLGEFSNVRHDNYIQVLSHGRNLGAGGKPHSSILDAEFDSNGSWVYGAFDGVDIRSEGLRDVYTTYYNQYVLTAEHEFTDRFRVDALWGLSRSHLKEPIRTTVQLDSPNRPFSWDFRENRNVPVLNFGFDLTDPSNFSFTTPALADGTLLGAWNGRYLSTKTTLETMEVNAEFEPIQDALTFRAGVSRRANLWDNFEHGPLGSPGFVLPVPLADVTRLISGFGDGLDASGAPSAWIAVDLDRFLSVADLHCACAEVPGATLSPNPNIRIVDETITAYYAMADFNFDTGPITWRGNAGVRYAETELEATGFVTVSPTVRELVTVPTSYEDWLPSLNLTAELTDDFYLRFSYAKVIARPDYVPLAPTATVNTTVQTVGIGNPFLEPFRADTFDLQAEWYFAEDSLLSVGIFHKEIDTFIQGFREIVPWNTLGLPDDLLTNGGTCSITGGTPACLTQPDTLVTVSRVVNTDGGPLTGVEISYQQPFTFLPGIWSNFGLLLNYSYIKSEIQYITVLDNPATPGNEEVTVTGDFTGLSRNAFNYTLYYEDDRISARLSSSFKDEAINNVLGNVAGHDFIFTDPATYYDAFASYKVNDRLRFTFEGLNLSDEAVRFGQDTERDDTRLWVHSGRTFTLGFNYRY